MHDGGGCVSNAPATRASIPNHYLPSSMPFNVGGVAVATNRCTEQIEQGETDPLPRFRHVARSVLLPVVMASTMRCIVFEVLNVN
jgi:hypothetical protein